MNDIVSFTGCGWLGSVGSYCSVQLVKRVTSMLWLKLPNAHVPFGVSVEPNSGCQDKMRDQRPEKYQGDPGPATIPNCSCSLDIIQLLVLYYQNPLLLP